MSENNSEKEFELADETGLSMVYKEVDQDVQCFYSGKTIETGEYGIGFNFHNYDDRSLWLSDSYIGDFLDLLRRGIQNPEVTTDHDYISIGRVAGFARCQVTEEALEHGDIILHIKYDPEASGVTTSRNDLIISADPNIINQLEMALQEVGDHLHLNVLERI